MTDKPDRPDRPISLRLPNRMLDEAGRRYKTEPGDRELGRSQAIRAALDRYYEVCRRHFVRLGLSRGELGLICEVHNGGMLAYDLGDDRGGASMIAVAVWHEIADAVSLHPGYAQQWDLSDEQALALVSKLQSAPYADLVALVDFVERFWADDPEAHKVIYPDASAD